MGHLLFCGRPKAKVGKKAQRNIPEFDEAFEREP